MLGTKRLRLSLLANGQLFCICRNVSDRKQTEAALAQSEAKFRRLVEDANDLIFSISLDGLFTYLSPQVSHIMGGYTAEELVGKSCNDFTHPDDISKVITSNQQLLATGEKGTGLEIRVARKNGGWSWMVCNTSPIRNKAGQIVGIQGIGRDISDLKAVEKTLKMTQFAVDNSALSIFWIDEAGRFLDVNTAACQRLGYSRAEPDCHARMGR